MSLKTPMASVPSPLGRSTKDHFSNDVIASASFLEFNPNYYLHLIKGQTIDLNHFVFGRTIPLPVPTYGRANIVYRYFYVPYSVVDKAYYDMKSDTRHNFSDNTSGYVSQTRGFLERDLISLLTNALIAEPSDENQYDFVLYVASSDTKEYYYFTPWGRFIYKILWSLGYRCSFNTSLNLKWHNALALLAAAKIWVDYYCPSQFVDNSFFYTLNDIINRDMSNNRDLSSSDLVNLATCFYYSAYDRDYFTSQFSKPYFSQNSFATVQISDISPSNPSYIRAQDESAYMGPSAAVQKLGSGNMTNSAPPRFSEYLIEVLNKLTSYYKRNQLAGGFAYNRMLAEFGMRIDNDIALYLGQYIVPLNIGDVMSTANTLDDHGDVGSRIGDYAGKALAFKNENGHVKFTANEPGIFIAIQTVKPYVSYYQGIDRHNEDSGKFDFFTPEFDGLGMQATSKSEVYMFVDGSKNATDNADIYSGVFGFTPRYSHLKFGRDNVIGDFNLHSLSEGLDAYHLFREFKDSSFSSLSSIAFGLEFCLTVDRAQYLRIFGLEQSLLDPFRIYSHYEVDSYAPWRSLYDDQVFDQLQHSSVGDSTFATGGARFE